MGMGAWPKIVAAPADARVGRPGSRVCNLCDPQYKPKLRVKITPGTKDDKRSTKIYIVQKDNTYRDDGTMRADDSAARAVARSHLREKPKDERALRPGRARRPFKRPSDDKRARARLSARRRELCAGLRLRAASDRAEWPHCGEPERRVRANREANAARRDVEREQRHGRAAQPLREGCGREQP